MRIRRIKTSPFPSPNALGIGAASFAKSGLQTSGFGPQTMGFFLSEKKTKASKDIAESPTAIAGTPKIET